MNNLRPSEVGQVLRFVFQPGGAAWTVASGQRLRLKISTNYRNAISQQPLYTSHVRIYHDGGSNASSFTITSVA
jgi:hypothetical protein